jgi:hypothetical protein
MMHFPLGFQRPQTIASFVACGALVAGLTVSSLGHRGVASSNIDLSASTVWFPDRATGQVSLLDGATASRVSIQRVASPNHAIEAVPAGV